MLLACLGEREEDTEELADIQLPGGENEPENPPQLNINMELTTKQRGELECLIGEYTDLFSERPGRTDVAKHVIDTGNATPITQRPYRVPLARRQVIKVLLDKMITEGTIRESNSAWASPVVLVDKADGTVRFCCDYRKLNEIAKFDAYPMPRSS